MVINATAFKPLTCKASDVLRFVVHSGDALIFALSSTNAATAFWLSGRGNEKDFLNFAQTLPVGTKVKIACNEDLEKSLQKIAAVNQINIEKNVWPLTDGEEFLMYSNGRVRRAPSPQIELRQATQKRVLIVDDSDSMRAVLEKVFAQDSRLNVVGSIGDPLKAVKAIDELRPDVVTLDIHMPGLDGPTLLGQILTKSFLPVVMISSVSIEDGDTVLKCLERGAVDYIQKPSFAELKLQTASINEKIFGAAQVRRAQPTTLTQNQRTSQSHQTLDVTRLIAMGASTGGTEALKEILIRLPAQCPPILIVQHIPPVFSLAFARRLNQLCAFEVKEAADGDTVDQGRALIAPGGFQMRIEKFALGFRVRIVDEAPVNRHKPSVDYLFDSVAQIYGRRAVGVLCTGMGTDGAKGLLKMKQTGSHTIVQDEASSVVFGMPGEAIKLGAATEVKPLLEISNALERSLRIENRRIA
jgi:two-component system, chemotaxis family, protein-glutamate methylesterase/glutaminase